MQTFENCKIFGELFTHHDHRLSQRKRKWTLSKKGTDHCFHVADAIDDVHRWLRCCCCWCWSWRCIGKYGRVSIVLFNVLRSSWPRNLVASQLFNLRLYMTKRLNIFHQRCYPISPIFHWIGLSTQQADWFSTLIDFPDAIFQAYCNCIRPCDLRVLQYIHINSLLYLLSPPFISHPFIQVFYVNSIITLQNLGHSDLILFIYQLKNKVNHYSMNWNTNWIFPLEDELDFSKGTLFFPLEDKLIRQTEFFLLEGELDFSKGIPLNFFP